MSKPKTVQKSKKPKSAPKWRIHDRLSPPPSAALDLARAAFDAAILGAVKACLGLSTSLPFGNEYMRFRIAAEGAGDALVSAGAALIRARAEEMPLPVKLTPKGERAALKSRSPWRDERLPDPDYKGRRAAKRRGPK